MILNVNANPESITQFHDELSNELPELKGNWNFSFKIFRNNPYSLAPEVAETSEISKETKFLHTLSPLYLKDSCICLINHRSVGVFTNLIDEEVASANNSSIPNDLMMIPSQFLHMGATTGLNDPFDMFSAHKLQSLWNLKQNIRGDGGQVYVLENGNLTIKTSNVFLHGIFKGLLIEICMDHVMDTDPSKLQKMFDNIIETYKIPQGKICYDVVDSQKLDKYGDLCLQYSEILNF